MEAHGLPNGWARETARGGAKRQLSITEHFFSMRISEAIRQAMAEMDLSAEEACEGPCKKVAERAKELASADVQITTTSDRSCYNRRPHAWLLHVEKRTHHDPMVPEGVEGWHKLPLFQPEGIIEL